jgi:GNAT superfamily N-acetyltransferase
MMYSMFVSATRIVGDHGVLCAALSISWILLEAAVPTYKQQLSGLVSLPQLWRDPGTFIQHFLSIGLDQGCVRTLKNVAHHLVSKMPDDDTSPNQDRIDWTLRPATKEDAGRCEKLLKASYCAMLAPDYDLDILSKALPVFTAPQEVLLTCGTWYVVEHPTTNEMVGCGGWTLRPTGPASKLTENACPHLRHFATHPEWTRRGIGKAIWRRILSDVAVAVGPATELEVFSSLTAEGFYASLGFVPVKQVDIPISGEDCVWPVILMRREP